MTFLKTNIKTTSFPQSAEADFWLVKLVVMTNVFFNKQQHETKVWLSPSKKNCAICFIESPLKMMKIVFYFILKALFVLKIVQFL